MSKNVETQNQAKAIFCQRCGRMIYENIKTGRIGCRNTHCRGYLLGSKNLDNTILRPFKR